jgi:hypothetical protein
VRDDWYRRWVWVLSTAARLSLPRDVQCVESGPFCRGKKFHRGNRRSAGTRRDRQKATSSVDESTTKKTICTHELWKD